MFRLASEQELRAAFRPRDQAILELPEGRGFPLTSLDYFAWTAQERVFLLFKGPQDAHVTGIAFKKDHPTGAQPGPRMCSWCHSHGSPDTIGLLSTEVNSKRRVGVYVCLDLGCGARIEDQANRQGKNAREAVKALLIEMGRFANDALGITQANRNTASAAAP